MIDFHEIGVPEPAPEPTRTCVACRHWMQPGGVRDLPPLGLCTVRLARFYVRDLSGETGTTLVIPTTAATSSCDRFEQEPDAPPT